MSLDLSSQGVWFPNWAVALARVRLKDLDRQAYRLAIVGYLSFCKRSRQRATVASARLFMAEMAARRRLSQSQLALWKTALNWFFQAAAATASGAPSGGAWSGEKPKAETLKPEGLLTPAPAPEGASKEIQPCARGKEPPLAAGDLGGPEWERALIRVLRERHYEWRTEQAYRMWARRFAAWLEERRPGFDTSPSIPLPDRGGEGSLIEAAGELELRGFLSDLAVRQRVAVATQKQALNAVAFLMREALGKPLADFGGFDRARPGQRLPVVLSKAECQRLLDALEATPRLMAQLMYGSGVRLMELLRLRVHPVR